MGKLIIKTAPITSLTQCRQEYLYLLSHLWLGGCVKPNPLMTIK